MGYVILSEERGMEELVYSLAVTVIHIQVLIGFIQFHH